MALRHGKLALALSGSSILLAASLFAQAPPARLHGPRTPAAQTAAPATLVATQTAPAPPTVAPSLLQEPAHEAKIAFAGDTLVIHADNSSLAGILRQFAAKSGMKIEGLGGDERVFGSFGPGAPRDVLADLLHGTTYNLVLLGDLENGAPRELILTPTTHGGAAASAPAQAPGAPPSNPEDAPTEPVASESDAESQGPLDMPTPVEDSPPAAPGTDTPAAPGVKSPQQLFEQLQRMRQTQQQNTTPDPAQQDSTTQ